MPDHQVSPRQPNPSRQSYAAIDRPVAKRPLPRPALALVGAAAIVVVTAGVIAYRSFALTNSISVTADRLVIGTVHRDLFQEFVAVSGTAAPETTVYLDAADGGEVSRVWVHDGDLVTQGQPLFTLRNPALELQVTSDEAQLAESMAQLASVRLDMAESKLSHQRDLLDTESALTIDQRRLDREAPLVSASVLPRVPQADLATNVAHEQSVRAILQAAVADDLANDRDQEADIDRAIALAKSGLAVASANLADLTVKAPIAGEITALDAHQGEVKAAGQRLGEVDETDGFKIAADVDQFYLGRVAVGGAATLDLDGATYRLRVATIDPEVKDRVFRADLVFVGTPPANLRAGQDLRPHLLIGDPHPSLVVANGGFLSDGEAGQVFVEDSDGKTARRHPVELGRTNPDLVEVLGGLAAGDRIIVSDTSNYAGIDRINITGEAP